MKRLLIVAVLLWSTYVMAQAPPSGKIPNTGANNQWTGNNDFRGTLTCNGVPCGLADVNGKNITPKSVTADSVVVGATVVGEGGQAVAGDSSADSKTVGNLTVTQTGNLAGKFYFLGQPRSTTVICLGYGGIYASASATQCPLALQIYKKGSVGYGYQLWDYAANQYRWLAEPAGKNIEQLVSGQSFQIFNHTGQSLFGLSEATGGATFYGSDGSTTTLCLGYGGVGCGTSAFALQIPNSSTYQLWDYTNNIYRLLVRSTGNFEQLPSGATFQVQDHSGASLLGISESTGGATLYGSSGSTTVLCLGYAGVGCGTNGFALQSPSATAWQLWDYTNDLARRLFNSTGNVETLPAGTVYNLRNHLGGTIFGMSESTGGATFYGADGATTTICLGYGGNDCTSSGYGLQMIASDRLQIWDYTAGRYRRLFTSLGNFEKLPNGGSFQVQDRNGAAVFQVDEATGAATLSTAPTTTGLPSGCVQYPCVVASYFENTEQTASISSTPIYTPIVESDYLVEMLLWTTTTASTSTVTGTFVASNGKANINLTSSSLDLSQTSVTRTLNSPMHVAANQAINLSTTYTGSGKYKYSYAIVRMR